jgi:hypothetical protein
MKYVIFNILSLVMHQGYAQGIFEFTLGVNYGTFAMKDLKDLQESYLTDLQPDIAAEIQYKFPPYYGYGLCLNFVGEGYSIGIEGGYNSTGGRVSYSDYSGKLLVDQLVRAPKISLQGQFLLSKEESGKSIKFYLLTSLGTSFNTYNLDYSIEAANTAPYSESIKFNSMNIQLGGGFLARKNFKRIFLTTEIKYQHDFAGNLKLSTNSDYTLLTPKGDKAKVDWSGIRFGIGIGISLNTSHKE